MFILKMLNYTVVFEGKAGISSVRNVLHGVNLKWYSYGGFFGGWLGPEVLPGFGPAQEALHNCTE